MKPLILIGGGGHCKSVIEATESAGYIILGILDKPEEVGKTVLSTKVIGVDDDIPQFVDKAEFMVTVGFIKNPSLRIALYERVKNAGGVMANVIANTAHVSRYAKMGGVFLYFTKQWSTQAQQLATMLSSILRQLSNTMLSWAIIPISQRGLLSMAKPRLENGALLAVRQSLPTASVFAMMPLLVQAA